MLLSLCALTLVAEDLCSFLDNAAQITDLNLRSCALHEREQGAREVAAALQRNTNIVTLKLCQIEGFVVPILEGLVSNTCLKNLVISSSLREATSNALQGLLESSTGSLQHLELIGIQFLERSFCPVAQGLINGSTVTDITFDHCNFHDKGSTQALNEILEQKRNLSSLAIKLCTFHPHPRLQQFRQALFSALRRPDSPLRHLQFCVANIGDLFPNQCFRVLCGSRRREQAGVFVNWES